MNLGRERICGKRSKYSSLFPVIIIGALLAAFVGARASVLSFTHDESFTYLQFVSGQSFRDAVLAPLSSSNNHYLNTLFMKVASALLGSSELSLRAPSILAYIVFLFSAFHVCRLLCSPKNVALAFLLLNLNPFLLEYFSLARGYALGLGFMMLSIFLFLRVLETRFLKPGFYIPCLIAAACAALANLTFLIYFISLLCVSLALMGFRLGASIRASRSTVSLRHWLPCLIWTICISSIFLTLILSMALRLKRLGELYYGGSSGFIPDTLFSLINASLYEPPLRQTILDLLAVIVPLFLIFATLLSVSAAIKNSFDVPSQKLLAVQGIAWCAVAANIAQNYLLGTKFLVERTAIIFVPLFVLFFVAFLEAAVRVSQLRIIRVAGLAVLLLANSAMAVNLFFSANFQHTRSWRYDADTKLMMNDLRAMAAERNCDNPLRLGVTWYLEPSVNYYAETKKACWLKRVSRDGILEGEYDYYFVSEEDHRLLATAKLTLVEHYTTSGNVLLKNPATHH